MFYPLSGCKDVISNMNFIKDETWLNLELGHYNIYYTINSGYFSMFCLQFPL